MAKPSPEVKTRFKMYKKGKLWLVAAAATAGLMAGGNVAQADNSTATSNSDQAVVANTNTGTSNDNNSGDDSTVALTTTTAVSNDSQVATASEDAVSTTANESTSAANTTQKATSSTDQAIDSASQASTEASKAAETVEQSTASATQDNQSNTKSETSSNVEADTVSMTTAAASASTTDQSSTSATKTTEVYSNGHWYLKDQNGKNLTGWQKLSDNRTVYYNATGEMLYGEQNISSKWYFFSTTDGNVAKGWYKLPDGRTVYYDVDNDGNGQGMLHGLQVINGKTYSLDNGTGAVLKSSEKLMNGYWYYFGSDGAMQTGFVTLKDGRTVYYNNKGQMLYGQQSINGKTYYFSICNGGKETGVVYNANKKVLQYYGEKDGSLSKGTVTIDGKTYVLDSEGNISLLNGENQVNGNWYLYDASAKKLKTGFQSVSGNRTVYYAPDTAIMVHGEKQIDGNWYYFDKWTGAEAISSFINLDGGRVVYYDDQGHMVHGEKQISGSWYYFDKGNGAEAISTFINLNDGRTVYYDGQGHMVKGWQNINNNTYYFDLVTGAMYTGTHYIDGTKHTFGSDGVEDTWGWPFPADGRGHFTGAQLFGVNAGGEFRLNGFHDGLDFGSIDHPGYEVHAVHKGIVTGIGYASGLDWYVLIDTGEYLTVYQEAFSSRSNIWVSVGQQVNVGDVIGGRTTAHLHLGITRQKNFNVALANSFNNNGTWINPLILLGN